MNAFEQVKVWLYNARTFHNRLMADYLRKRGWVVFYLDDDQRECHGTGFCWLQVYNESESRRERI